MYKKPKKLTPVQSFQLFCLESYRSAKDISGIKALNDFKQARVFRSSSFRVRSITYTKPKLLTCRNYRIHK